jgi:hypothetical protein|tara:strand:- start:599 stop:958 length:360 start_codon:yes stop_codon:yes gene_type:complete
MATVTSKLTLTSADSLSDSLSINVLDILSVTNPAENSRVSVLHTAPTELAPVSTGAHYVYIKNIGTNSRVVEVRIAAGTAFASLAVGEFCFVPMKTALGVEVIAITGTEVVEYAIFKKA